MLSCLRARSRPFPTAILRDRNFYKESQDIKNMGLSPSKFEGKWVEL